MKKTDKQHEKRITELLTFYRDKSKEKGGGKMFKVFIGRRPHYSVWGRSKEDVHRWLAVNSVKFDYVSDLI